MSQHARPLELISLRRRQVKKAFENLKGWSDGIKATTNTSPEHYRAVFRWIQAAQRLRCSMPGQPVPAASAGSAKSAGDLSRDKGAERSLECNGDESGRRQQQARAAAGLRGSSGRQPDGIGEVAGQYGSNSGQQAGSGCGTDDPRGNTTVKNSGCNPSLSRSSSWTGRRSGDGRGGHTNGLTGRSRTSSARDCGGDTIGLCEAHLGFAGGDGSFDLAGTERTRSFRRFGGLAGDSEASVAAVARQRPGDA